MSTFTSGDVCRHGGGQTRETREPFVERHADSGVLVLPAYVPHPGFVVRQDGFRFRAAA
jgi:hypothetical protein